VTIERDQITGMVLAGGRGSRMGGVDKGLQNHLGMPMALHTLLRLAPQVGSVMINANRNLAAYESMGVPVWPDAQADYPGPLAGMLAGLERCETPYLVTVPCDTPNFPLDLVERLARALDAEGADLAMAATRRCYLEMHASHLMSLWFPFLRDLRKTPAFKQFVRDLGFYHYWRASGHWGDYARPLGDDDFEVLR